MAITKRTEQDKIEVVGEFKHIQVRTATIIEEDGVELSRSFSRHVVVPYVSDYAKDDDGVQILTNGNRTYTHTETDISGEDADVQAIANAAWTDANKTAARASFEALNPAD